MTTGIHGADAPASRVVRIFPRLGGIATPEVFLARLSRRARAQ